MAAICHLGLNWTDTSLQYSTATVGCVSNDFFRHSLDDSQASYLTQLPSPSLNIVELIVFHNRPYKRSSKLQLSFRFTPSRCLDDRQDWYPMYYPKGMKTRMSPVQSIKPHRILAPIRDSNQEPLDPQSEVVAPIPPLHTYWNGVNIWTQWDNLVKFEFREKKNIETIKAYNNI